MNEIGYGAKSRKNLNICWCGSMAEQLICNQQVDGSTPFTSFIFEYGSVPEWPKGTDCKSAAIASVVRIHPLPFSTLSNNVG